MAVPKRFSAVEARKLVQQSLATSDGKLASVRAAELRVSLMREWGARVAEAKGGNLGNTPSESELQSAATTLGYVRTGETVAEWWSEAKRADEDCHAQFIAKLQQRRQRYVEQRETTQAAFWRYVAESLLNERGWCLPEGEGRDRLGHMVAEAVIDRLGVEIEERNGNFGAEPRSKLVRRGLSALGVEAPADETIMLLFERYAGQRIAEGRKRADTVNQDRIIVRQFAHFVGTTRKISSVEPRKCGSGAIP
jgi:hypothetical protein